MEDLKDIKQKKAEDSKEPEEAPIEEHEDAGGVSVYIIIPNH